MTIKEFKSIFNRFPDDTEIGVYDNSQSFGFNIKRWRFDEENNIFLIEI